MTDNDDSEGQLRSVEQSNY